MNILVYLFVYYIFIYLSVLIYAGEYMFKRREIFKYPFHIQNAICP